MNITFKMYLTQFSITIDNVQYTEMNVLTSQCESLYSWDRYPVVSSPLPDGHDDEFCLGLGGATEDLYYILQTLPGLMAGYHQLQKTHTGTTLPLPVLRVGVQTLKNIKCLGSVIELTHLRGGGTMHINNQQYSSMARAACRAHQAVSHYPPP